ncbi:hypothetical protein Pve01_41780 [Planomonospora venezuelensis]|nr:hypothetical protein Pve01_41780 [Planomonospora venezuelensis]
MDALQRGDHAVGVGFGKNVLQSSGRERVERRPVKADDIHRVVPGEEVHRQPEKIELVGDRHLIGLEAVERRRCGLAVEGSARVDPSLRAAELPFWRVGRLSAAPVCGGLSGVKRGASDAWGRTRRGVLSLWGGRGCVRR